MTQLDKELISLQEEIGKMWDLVVLQMQKAKISLVANDKDLAREVILSEKRVNSYELTLDRDCENVFALYCPVAVDLRFLLAILKINNNLERIGDYAEGIARYVIHAPSPFDVALLEKSKLIKMYDESAAMLNTAHKAFLNEDTIKARNIFKQDEMLDDINLHATHDIADYIKENPDNTEQALYVLSIIRKIERVGDQIKNIAEEIIFFLEAKVIKHNQVEKPQ